MRATPVIPLPNPGEGGPVADLNGTNPPSGGSVPVVPLPDPGAGGPVADLNPPSDGATPVIPLPNPGEGGPVGPIFPLFPARHIPDFSMRPLATVRSAFW